MSLPSSMADFVPCDRLLQKAYFGRLWLQIALALRAHSILVVFEKIYSCLFIPNCTRNHVITYTKIEAKLSLNNAWLPPIFFLDTKIIF